MADAKTPRERAEALFTIERHEGAEGVSWIVRDARGVPVDRCGTETSARTSVRWRAEPIAAAIEAAARDATEAAAAVCDAAAARYERDYERRGDQCDSGAARALDDAARAIRAGGTGGEHGQR